MTTTKRASNHKLLALLLGLLLTALLLCALAPRAYAEIASGTLDTCSWVIDDDGNLVISPTNGAYGEISTRKTRSPWSPNGGKIKTISFEKDVVIVGQGLNLMFSDLYNVQKIDFTNCSFRNVTSTEMMFSGDAALTEVIGLNNLDTSQVTTMYRMFYDCPSLEEIDLSNLNTSNVKNMSQMFAPKYGTSNLKKLDLSTWDVSSVTNMQGMLMYGKEASNRKQEIDRQHYTIPNQRPKDKHCGKI